MTLHRSHPPTSGLILAGGRSNRFGSDKAAATLNGKSLLELAVDGLRPCCDRVAVSARPNASAAALAADLKLEVLTDRSGDPAGPLAGIRAGLEWALAHGAAHLAVRPVDTPFLPADVFDSLARVLGAAPAAYCVTADGPQPLCALWTPAALPRLNHLLAEHRHPPVFQLLDDLGAIRLPVEDAGLFRNVNTAADLAAAKPNTQL